MKNTKEEVSNDYIMFFLVSVRCRTRKKKTKPFLINKMKELLWKIFKAHFAFFCAFVNTKVLFHWSS